MAVTGQRNLSFQWPSLVTATRQNSVSPQRKGSPNTIPTAILLLLLLPSLNRPQNVLLEVNLQLLFKYIPKNNFSTTINEISVSHHEYKLKTRADSRTQCCGPWSTTGWSPRQPCSVRRRQQQVSSWPSEAVLDAGLRRRVV